MLGFQWKVSKLIDQVYFSLTRCMVWTENFIEHVLEEWGFFVSSDFVTQYFVDIFSEPDLEKQTPWTLWSSTFFWDFPPNLIIFPPNLDPWMCKLEIIAKMSSS